MRKWRCLRWDEAAPLTVYLDAFSEKLRDISVSTGSHRSGYDVPMIRRDVESGLFRTGVFVHSCELERRIYNIILFGFYMVLYRFKFYKSREKDSYNAEL